MPENQDLIKDIHIYYHFGVLIFFTVFVTPTDWELIVLIL